MVRGIYTGASAMAAKSLQMNVIANNLANVNTTGYKRDEMLFKAFPEMLINRINDNGVHKFPLGSWDKRPVVGKLGTGVEVNEVYTQNYKGNLQQTSNPLDLALSGDQGYFSIQTPAGERYTRNGSFTIGKEGILMTQEGYPILGTKGIIKVKHGNFLVSNNGEVLVNDLLQEPPDLTVQDSANAFESANIIDKLKLVDFPRVRFLKKEGHSLFAATNESGEAEALTTAESFVRQGYLENSNVNVIREMVNMIEVQRAYEASQKSITSHDSLLQQLINNMSRA